MYTFATLISTDNYLIGALVLYKSLMLSKSKYELVVLLTDNISKECEDILYRHKIKSKRIGSHIAMDEEIGKNNTNSGHLHWNHSLSKILIFDLLEYKKIIFLDSDMYVLINIDHLFEKPHMSAVVAGALLPAHKEWKDLNSGLMVIEPDKNVTSSLLLSYLPQVEKQKKYFGDQDILHAYYPEWRNQPALHLDQKYNVLDESVNYYVRFGYNLNFRHPDEKTIAVVHFTGAKKPWMESPLGKVHHIQKGIMRGSFANIRLRIKYYLAIYKISRNRSY